MSQYGPFADAVDNFRPGSQARRAGRPVRLCHRRYAQIARVGIATLMEIRPAMRVIEVGHIVYSPGAATHAARHRGAIPAWRAMPSRRSAIRRYEWKCNALNAASRRARLRYGFTFEGILRQHMIAKGRNRDTAMFSMLDSEWPARKAQFRALAVAGQFRRRRQAECQPERAERHRRNELSRSHLRPDLAQQRPFVLFWLARLASTMGYQMLALTIGWKIYEITNSAFDLGLVGLIQFVPAVVLTLLIGHAADRYDRRLIVRAAQSVYALAAVMITVALLTGVLGPRSAVCAVFMIGCARAFELPTAHALAPTLVPCPADLARGGGLDLRQSGGGHLWPGARRTDLRAEPGGGRRRFAWYSSPARSRWSASSAPKGSGATAEPPTFASVLAGFHYIRSRRATARRHHARPVRGDSRRRHRTAADLRQGYSGRSDRSASACCARRRPSAR